jgi:hypothetical protein
VIQASANWTTVIGAALTALWISAAAEAQDGPTDNELHAAY